MKHNNSNEPLDNIIAIPKGTYTTGRYRRKSDWFVGKLVKLAFRGFAPGELEWMWVTAQHVNVDGDLVGRLENSPVFATYLRSGDSVVFRGRDVVEIG